MKLLIAYICILISYVACSQSAYDILGVKKSANVDSIKQAYRKKAKQLHPDKNKDNPNAQEEFIKLSGAYETLSDPQKKAEYDESLNPNSRFNGHHMHQQQHRGGFGGGNPHEFSRFHQQQYQQQRQSQQNVFVYRGPDGQFYYASGNPFQDSRFSSNTYSYNVNLNEYSIFNIFMQIVQFCISNFPIILIGVLLLKATIEGNRNRAREQQAAQHTSPHVRTNIGNTNNSHTTDSNSDIHHQDDNAPLEDLTLAHFVSYHKSTILIIINNTDGWLDKMMLKRWKVAFASDKLLFRVTNASTMQSLLISNQKDREGISRGDKVLQHIWNQLSNHKLIAIRSNCSNLIDTVTTLEDWCIKTTKLSFLIDSNNTNKELLNKEVESWCISIIGGEVKWHKNMEMDLGH